MKRTIIGRVRAVLVAPDQDAIEAQRQPAITLTMAGVEGDRHAGVTMLSGGRTPAYPRGTEIRNSRQVSLVSVEELGEVAAAMRVPAIEPEWLGANVLLDGIPSLSILPPSTRLFFESGAVLVVEGENGPCTIAGAVIQAAYPEVDGLTQLFPKEAIHKRGIVAWVERPGAIAQGDSVRAEIPVLAPYPA
jgi:MOSC domain-containing protein YiiM